MGYDLLYATVLFDYSEMLMAKNKHEQAYQLIDSIKKVTHKREEISELAFLGKMQAFGIKKICLITKSINYDYTRAKLLYSRSIIGYFR